LKIVPNQKKTKKKIKKTQRGDTKVMGCFAGRTHQKINSRLSKNDAKGVKSKI